MPRPPVLPRLAAAVSVVLLGVACSDDDDAPDAAARSTTTSSVAVSSTAAPPRSATRSIVVGAEGLLGGWQEGRWVTPDDPGLVPVAGGETYTVLRLTDPEIEATGAAPVAPEEFCGTPQVELTPGLRTEDATDHIDRVAVHGVEDPTPRPTTLLDPAAATYRDAARDALAVELGLEDEDPELAQVVRADLSGDGTDEVLVVAERLADPASRLAEAGDYSVVLLREVVDGEVRTTVVTESRNDASPESPSPFLVASRVAAIADLNGDGTMEVVLDQGYYEGSSVSVYELGAAGLTEVLAAGCGV